MMDRTETASDSQSEVARTARQAAAVAVWQAAAKVRAENLGNSPDTSSSPPISPTRTETSGNSPDPRTDDRDYQGRSLSAPQMRPLRRFEKLFSFLATDQWQTELIQLFKSSPITPNLTWHFQQLLPFV